MSDVAIHIQDVSKMYKLYRRNVDKVIDVFGINHFLFWRKKYYQEFWALKNINLTLKKGTRLGIIGRNGAGKSTLLKIISGNIPCTQGKVEVIGNIQALMELGTGFHPEFTGRENIRASLSYQGLKHTKILEKEEEIIDFAELDDFIDQPIKTYSAGMYARLAFSTATAIKPEILIIDEVLGAGDAYFSAKCVKRMKKLTIESGATILFVSHDLVSMQRLCEQAIWIDSGEIVAKGDTLYVSKLYSASIRKQEELRLKTRNLKLKKEIPHTNKIDISPKTQDVSNTNESINYSTPGDVYGDKRMSITNVEFLNQDFRHKHVFNSNDYMIIRTHFTSNITTDSFIFCIVIYTEGIAVHRWLSNEKISIKKGEHYFDLAYPKLPFGPGDYYISIALYPEFNLSDDSRLQPAYNVWDRKIGFRILPPENVASGNTSFIYTDTKCTLTHLDTINKESQKCPI